MSLILLFFYVKKLVWKKIIKLTINIDCLKIYIDPIRPVIWFVSVYPIVHPLHLTWPLFPLSSHRGCSNPLSLVFFNPWFPLTFPSSLFVVILPLLLNHRIGRRRPFRESYQSRLSICNGDSLCPSRVGSRQSTVYFSSSIFAHWWSLCHSPFSSPLSASPAWRNEREKEKEGRW